MGQDLSALLHSRFGFPAFRPGQAEAIEGLLAGRHTLVVMPTGAGKSLVYQLGALCLPGLTLVLSPLIALMKDQVDALNRRHVPATCINSALSGEEQSVRLAHLAAGAYRLAYVAPERLRSVPFQEALRRVSVSLLAVDEAHCISQWGHDFRPDYLHIATVRPQIGEPLTVALTATATPQVQDDIVRLLGLPEARRIVTGFNRPNLTFETRYTATPQGKLQAIQELLDAEEGRGGAVIIYTGTRSAAEEVALFVRQVAGVQAEHYHAGLDGATRSRIQEAFISGDLPVVVATNAFGMGIDRPDVRLVLHFALPSTLEAYYQEAGRAGRDGEPARAVLLYSPKDRALQEWFIENDAPALEEVRSLHMALTDWGRGLLRLGLDDLSLATSLPEVKVRVGLAQLEAAGALERLGDEGAQMLLRPGPWDEAALRLAADGVELRRRHRREQLERMIAYAETDTCRRRLLLDHFGDAAPPEAPRCCDNCLARVGQAAPSATGSVLNLSQSERAALIILDALRRLKWATGRTKLAQLLFGSRAGAMRQFGYDRSPYFGRLAVFQRREIAGLIDQLVRLGYLKTVGGELPVLRLTPKGEEALRARAAIPLRLPRTVQPDAVARKQAERQAGGTVNLTKQMLEQGLCPAEIAGRRGLTEETIYQHLARLIEEGAVALEAVLSQATIERVQEAITRVGSVAALSPLKMLLPNDISYGQIRCVAAAWTWRESGHDGERPEARSDAQRVVLLGNERLSTGVPELLGALRHPDGNVRRLAASALGKIKDRRATQPLLALLDDERKPQVRQHAVRALGELRDPQARPLLTKIAADPEERDDVRSSAQFALQRLNPRPGQGPDGEAAAFLARSHPRPLAGPWQVGWALGFHSRFSGADWGRSPAGELTYRLKYQGDRTALPPLVEQALALCKEHPELAAAEALVAVPPTEARAFDPVSAFAAALAARLGKPVWQALAKVRRTAPQKEMHTLAQKRANVAGAFAVRGEVRGKKLLVVDDLYDSGATLEEISRVLRTAGAAGVCVLTLTRTIHAE